MRPRIELALSLLLFVLTSCTVGPDYQPPKLDVPAQFTRSVLGGAAPSAPADLARWWTSLGDPVLDRLIEQALATSPDPKIAAARVREARAGRTAADAALWPTLGSHAIYTRERRSEGTPFGAIPIISPEDGLFDLGFDASWEIDLFGGNRRAAEAAAADLDASEEALRDVRVTLLSEVARDYVGLRALEQRLAIAQQNIEAQSHALDLTSDRLRAGLSSELDVSQAKSLLASTQAQVPALESGIHQTIHRLGVLVGVAPTALADELGTPAPIPAAANPDEVAQRIPVGLPADLLRRRPDVRRAERQVAAATARIGVATADLFPKLSLTGVGGLQATDVSDFFNITSRAFSVGPAVRWPIFEAGRIRASIEARDAQQEAALETYRKAVLQSLADVEDALVAYGKDRDRHRSLAEAAQASARAETLARSLYTSGLGSFYPVLDAQRSRYADEDALVESERASVLDLIALYKALGGGWEESAASADLSLDRSR